MQKCEKSKWPQDTIQTFEFQYTDIKNVIIAIWFYGMCLLAKWCLVYLYNYMNNTGVHVCFNILLFMTIL